MTQWTFSAQHVVRQALFHQRAVGGREGMKDIAPGAGEGALIARLRLAFEGLSHLRRREPGVDGDDGLLIGKQDPLPVLLRQIAPRAVDVVAERRQDVALVLSLPRRWPRGDGALPDRE